MGGVALNPRFRPALFLAQPSLAAQSDNSPVGGPQAPRACGGRAASAGQRWDGPARSTGGPWREGGHCGPGASRSGGRACRRPGDRGGGTGGETPRRRGRRGPG
jgi:hypothetical protein